MMDRTSSIMKVTSTLTRVESALLLSVLMNGFEQKHIAKPFDGIIFVVSIQIVSGNFAKLNASDC